MEEFLDKVNLTKDQSGSTIREIARQHIIFERIHPFRDGNGRTGRMILNQQLMNCGFLPISITAKSRYNQSFRQYDNKKDFSLMTHLLCKEQINAVRRVQELAPKKVQRITEK